MNSNEVKTGSIATVKVGRNLVEVEILGAEGDKWKVKSISSGREFLAARLESIKTPEPAAEPEGPQEFTPAAAEPEDAPNPAPESGSAGNGKKTGLYEAAVEVLRQSETPLNCKAIIAKATELGLWKPTGGKTPEQSLYSGIFRQIKTKENPRIVKSTTVRGAFEINRG